MTVIKWLHCDWIMLLISLIIVVKITVGLCSEPQSGTKCCPSNYTYISSRHFCLKNEYANQSYSQNKVVETILPDCKVVLDEEINTTVSNISKNFYCINQNEKGSLMTRKCYDTLNICSEIRCIKKCCPQGQSFINTTKCSNSTVDFGFDLTEWSHVVGENTGMP